ncbi:flavodoxin-dependent (E)-4-hydroxy-3-methylbut-2-enyl-diphosphate synthase [Streptomyces huasconensis]|uniref:Flavodoxin-dependent (E)-4-hydroxy-3-methylbut-2-enyl-diphosphate synthase n=1 Tax=Streptomyces huasconensis TaxID=1854574 RepID=A0ABV3M7L5_9ACTN
MATFVEPTAALDFEGIRRDADKIADEFLVGKVRAGKRAGPTDPHEAADALRAFPGGGGKRLRPLLCIVGRCAAGGADAFRQGLQVAASPEMFHTFVLIDDDIMDRSASRRGRPSVHRAQLTAAGCDIIRVSAPSQDGTDALPAFAAKPNIPVTADVHFQPRYVFAALDAGCATVRADLGNMRAFDDKVKVISNVGSAAGASIRIGVNAGSVRRRIAACRGALSDDSQGLDQAAS